ncbi:hypothetical protein SCHPADRAFT_761052 [Schizopora paradoxa]|uniref:Uncharacterized protein n=1 Tax=Schizopora paradoxa TaxID=27342 RepID=A0A0H2RGX9_9AGAM|nr:hypothetical protein SCHPADRAFT_761052 [Schizopora paradoxa]
MDGTHQRTVSQHMDTSQCEGRSRERDSKEKPMISTRLVGAGHGHGGTVRVLGMRRRHGRSPLKLAKAGISEALHSQTIDSERPMYATGDQVALLLHVKRSAVLAANSRINSKLLPVIFRTQVPLRLIVTKMSADSPEVPENNGRSLSRLPKGELVCPSCSRYFDRLQNGRDGDEIEDVVPKRKSRFSCGPYRAETLANFVRRYLIERPEVSDLCRA